MYVCINQLINELINELMIYIYIYMVPTGSHPSKTPASIFGACVGHQFQLVHAMHCQGVVALERRH